jgi:hypothetical protein
MDLSEVNFGSVPWIKHVRSRMTQYDASVNSERKPHSYMEEIKFQMG